MAELQTTLQDLETAGRLEEVWPGYRLIDRDVVFELRPGCVAHWSKGKIVTSVETTVPLSLSTPLFGFLVTALARGSVGERLGGFLTGDVPPEIVDSLTKAGAKSVVALPIEAHSAGDSSVRRFERSYFLQHESFHAQVWLPQLMRLTEVRAWPEWSKQPDKGQLVARCYSAPSVAPTLIEERATLVEALRAADTGNFERARAEGRAFVAIRQRRYALLSAERVPSKDGTISCADAEAIWELDEGSADYVTMRTLEAAGLWRRDEIMGRIGEGTSVEPYYHLGAGQLLLLQRLAPTKMRDVLVALTASTQPSDGIFGQLRLELER